jgi:hypothetical protein
MLLDVSAIFAIIEAGDDGASLAGRLGQATRVYVSAVAIYDAAFGLARRAPDTPSNQPRTGLRNATSVGIPAIARSRCCAVIPRGNGVREQRHRTPGTLMETRQSRCDATADTNARTLGQGESWTGLRESMTPRLTEPSSSNLHSSPSPERAGCPVCRDSHTATIAFRKDNFDIYRCSACHFLFVYPYPHRSAIEAHYNSNYRQASKSYYPKARQRRGRAFYEAFSFYRYVRGMRVLDLGCGGGVHV